MKCKEELNDKGQHYHICCKKGDIGEYVILPGDPFRTDKIAMYLDDPIVVAHNREHKTWTGKLNGVKVSVTSTGMGGPSTAIAVEELISCGAKYLIRIGTCGRVCEESFKEELEGIIVTGAIRDEGTTQQYVPLSYPAIPNREIVESLAESAKDNNYCFAEGIAQSKDAFYGQTSPESLPNGDNLIKNWKAWEMANVMATEMEASTLFVVASIRGVKSGCILAYNSMTDKTIKVTCDAIKKLIEKRKD